MCVKNIPWQFLIVFCVFYKRDKSMSINSIKNKYFYNNQGEAAKSSAPIVSSSPYTNSFVSCVPLNSIFDEFVLNNAQNLKNVQNINNLDEEKVKIIAHRGYSEIAPENTIPAFIAAAENGYNTVECDIEWTKDDVPVILHDETINRTARRQNGWRMFWPRKCSNMTYEKLLEYDFGSWFSNDFKGTKIPKFDELLNCANEYNLNLYVELKEIANFDDKKAQKLVDEVKKAGLEDKVTWISFNEDYLKMMADISPNSRLGYLSKKDINKDTIDTLKSLQTGANEVFLDVKSAKISESSCKMLEEAGFNFEAWTVDDAEEIKDLAEFDCKGITTNKITEDDIADYYSP